MKTSSWIVTLHDGQFEEVKAVACDVGNKALVFRKGAGLGEKDGQIVRAYAHGSWKDVKMKEEK